MDDGPAHHTPALTTVFNEVVEQMRHNDTLMLTSGLGYLTVVALTLGQIVQGSGTVVDGVLRSEFPLVLLSGFGVVALLYQTNTRRWKAHYHQVAQRIGDHWRSLGRLPDDPGLVMVWLRPTATPEQRQEWAARKRRTMPAWRFGVSSIWLTLTRVVGGVVVALAGFSYWDSVGAAGGVMLMTTALAAYIALAWVIRRDLTRQSLDEPFSL